jgi:hypothetical protein
MTILGIKGKLNYVLKKKFLTLAIKIREGLISWTTFSKTANFYKLSSSLFSLILFLLLSSELSPAVPHLELSCL